MPKNKTLAFGRFKNMAKKSVNDSSSLYIQELEKETAVYAYIDLSNVFHWQEVLGWNFRIEDMLNQIISLKSIKEVKVYFGFNERQVSQSTALHKRIRKTGAILTSKPVKFIKKTIDKAFLFKKSTLTLFNAVTRSKVTELIKEIRKTGILIEEPKCNFDVEMTMDLIDDTEKMSAVMLFSGDSDMAGPLERLKLKGRKIYVVGVRGMVAKELHDIKDQYIDFGKFYSGSKKYPLDSENPAFGRDRVIRRQKPTTKLYPRGFKKSSKKKVTKT